MSYVPDSHLIDEDQHAARLQRLRHLLQQIGIDLRGQQVSDMEVERHIKLPHERRGEILAHNVGAEKV